MITGILDEDFTITPKQLSEMTLFGGNTKGESANGSPVNIRATGVTLETFLAEYGCAPADFEMIRFFARDAYRITLSHESISENQIIIALTGNNAPLTEGERPMRLLIPNMETNQWIYAIERIEFVFMGESK